MFTFLLLKLELDIWLYFWFIIKFELVFNYIKFELNFVILPCLFVCLFLFEHLDQHNKDIQIRTIFLETCLQTVIMFAMNLVMLVLQNSHTSYMRLISLTNLKMVFSESEVLSASFLHSFLQVFLNFISVDSVGLKMNINFLCCWCATDAFVPTTVILHASVHVWDPGIFTARPVLSQEGASTHALAASIPASAFVSTCVVLSYIAACLLSSFFL